MSKDAGQSVTVQPGIFLACIFFVNATWWAGINGIRTPHGKKSGFSSPSSSLSGISSAQEGTTPSGRGLFIMYNGAYEASIRAQLKDVEGKLNNLVKAIEAGIFNSTTAERMNVLENQKSMLNDALLAEQNRKKCDLTLNTIVKFLSSLVGDINNRTSKFATCDFGGRESTVYEHLTEKNQGFPPHRYQQPGHAPQAA